MSIVSEPLQTTDESITELRVHGVGGSSPTDLMGVPHVTLVAGTLKAGFYRSAQWIPLDGPRRNLEGYSWGGMTSRSLGRALWAVLLPFALLNLGGWMFPHRGTATNPVPRGAYENIMLGVYRLVGLAATAATTVLAGVVTIDLVGVRCVARSGCTDSVYLAPWRWFAAGDVVQGAALAAVVAVGGLLLVGLLTRSGQANADRIDNARKDDPAYRDRVAKDLNPDMRFWNRPDVAHRLGLAHLSTALALVGLMLIETVGSVASLPTALTGLRWVLLAVVATEVILVGRLSLASGKIHIRLFLLTGALVALSVLITWLRPAALVEVEASPFRSTLLVTLSLTGIMWLAAVFADILRSVTGSMTVKTDRFEFEAPERFKSRPKEGTLTTRLSLAFLGLGIIVAFGSAFSMRVADILDVDYTTRTTLWIALLAVTWLLAAGLTALVKWIRQPKRPTEEIAREYRRTAQQVAAGRRQSTLEAGNRADERWLRSVANGEAAARVTDEAGNIFVTATAATIGVAAVLAFADGLREWAFMWAVPPATWFLGGLPVVAIVTLERLIRSPRARRGFGIIWDVATFWPRWFHPWSPPSYGEHTVPHLTERLTELTKSENVLLSAHSQGTVLSASALCRLEPDALAKITFLTHGCPLERLYQRFFPEHFDQEFFAELCDRLASAHQGTAWTNLHRRTDYIGGSLFAEIPARGADTLVLDPFDSERALLLDPRPALLRHSDYYRTYDYRDALQRFADDVTAANGGGEGTVRAP